MALAPFKAYHTICLQLIFFGQETPDFENVSEGNLKMVHEQLISRAREREEHKVMQEVSRRCLL